MLIPFYNAYIKSARTISKGCGKLVEKSHTSPQFINKNHTPPPTNPSQQTLTIPSAPISPALPLAT